MGWTLVAVSNFTDPVAYDAAMHGGKVVVSTLKARVVGTGSARITFTRRPDIGDVLAKALADPKVLSQGGTLSIAGETMSYKKGLETLEGVLGQKFEIEVIDPAVALQRQEELLAEGLGGNVGAFYESFVLNMIGEPERGNTRADTSAGAVAYGCKLESLAETLRDVYASK